MNDLAGREPTTFLNVDLDVEADEDLTPLVDALSAHAFCLTAEWDHGVHRVSLELTTDPTDAESAIRAFASALSALTGTPERLWRTARRRTFDVGVSAGTTHSFALRLSETTVQWLGVAGACVVLTVYGAAASASRGS